MSLPKEHCKKCGKLEVKHLTDQHKFPVNEKFEPWGGKKCPECKKQFDREKSKRSYLKKKGESNTPSEYNWNCKHCEKDFKTSYKGNKNQGGVIRYCSSKCQNKALQLRKAGMMKGEGKCGQCGSIYKKESSHTTSCQNCKDKTTKRKEDAKLQKDLVEENRQDKVKQKAEYRNLKKKNKKHTRYAKLLEKKRKRLIKLGVEKNLCLTCQSDMPRIKKKYCSKGCVPRSAAKDAARKAMKRMKKERKLSSVTWNEIAEYYSERPVGFHVDHIIPLNSKFVSGLHVPWNFQYLSESDNIKKTNKFDGTYENLKWLSEE